MGASMGNEDGNQGTDISERTLIRMEDTLRYHEGQLRRYERDLDRATTGWREAELGIKRERFIRITAIQLAEALLPDPARYGLDEEQARSECWRRAKALWDAKPEDC